MTPRNSAPIGTRRRIRGLPAALLLCAACTGLAIAGGKPAAVGQTAQHSSHAPLPRPDSLQALHAQSAAERRPVVALFSTAGCGWCEALRSEQLQHLARDARRRGVLVVEFDLADRRAFSGAGTGIAGKGLPAPAWPTAGSPAELARLLGVRVAPTLVFLGPSGEAAAPLVGYTSPDFYGAYLDERIEQARTAVEAR